MKISVVKTSLSSELQAKKLAEALLEARLAACVQISGSGLSLYRWQDKVEHEQECYMSIKTSTELCDEVVSWLHEHHPYETPEIVWSVCEASPDYANWLADMVK
ncbi:divalent-cation tolerance protein CutA [Mariprofundus micogutta]|nr:divalent-cation tolerance protein CutA [Mariprofundus micogutta]